MICEFSSGGLFSAEEGPRGVGVAWREEGGNGSDRRWSELSRKASSWLSGWLGKDSGSGEGESVMDAAVSDADNWYTGNEFVKFRWNLFEDLKYELLEINVTADYAVTKFLLCFN